MNLRFILLTASMALLASCSSTPSCYEPQLYQESREADPVDVPDDLDNLQSHKELKIPDASPRPPRPANADCLEKPPVYQSTSS